MTRTQIGSFGLTVMFFSGSGLILSHDAYLAALPYMLTAFIVGYINGIFAQ